MVLVDGRATSDNKYISPLGQITGQSTTHNPMGQIIQGNNYALGRVVFYSAGGSSFNTGTTISAKVWNATGTINAQTYTGSALTTSSNSIDTSSVLSSGSVLNFDFSGSGQIFLDSSNRYAIGMYLNSSPSSGLLYFDEVSIPPFTGNIFDNLGVNQGTTTTQDLRFLIYGTYIPIASFTASQRDIALGESIFFTDTTTREPTSWSWDFGDGTTSTVQNPSHTYTGVGNYTVTLTATNVAGSNTATAAIRVSVKPVLTGISQLKGVGSIKFS